MNGRGPSTEVISSFGGSLACSSRTLDLVFLETFKLNMLTSNPQRKVQASNFDCKSSFAQAVPLGLKA
jgi:hypothetical protein